MRLKKKKTSVSKENDVKWCMSMPGTTSLQAAKRSAGQSNMLACPMQFLQDMIHGREEGREIILRGSFHLLHSSHTCKGPPLRSLRKLDPIPSILY